jgi:hypothetical protein
MQLGELHCPDERHNVMAEPASDLIASFGA